MQQPKPALANIAVNDEPILTGEELERLATIFDVLIDIDFYLNYIQQAER